MRLDHPDDDVDPVAQLGAGRLQHLVGLADAGGGADEDLQLAEMLLLPSRLGEKGLGRRTLVVNVATLIRHGAPCFPIVSPAYLPAVASSARLSASTLTCGSPIRPRSRPVISPLTSSRSLSSGKLRALATRGTWNRAASGEMSGS